MPGRKLVVLGLAVAGLLLTPLAFAEEIPSAAAPQTCPAEAPAGTEVGLPGQPLDEAIFASPGLCPTLCPMTCPSTWTCNFGNCVCD